jgi:hypothetical protein
MSATGSPAKPGSIPAEPGFGQRFWLDYASRSCSCKDAHCPGGSIKGGEARLVKEFEPAQFGGGTLWKC